MMKRWVVLGAAAATLAVAACSGTDSSPDGGAAGTGGGAAGGNQAGTGGNGGAGGGTAGASAGSSMTAGRGGEGGAGRGGSSAGRGGAGGAAGVGGAGGGIGLAGSSNGGGPACDPVISEDEGSGACQDFTPCGGDVVGSWDMTMCADPALTGLKTLCPTATETLSIVGQIDIRADGTMTSSLTSRSQTLLPASCVADLGQCGVPGGAINLLEDCTPADGGSCRCDNENVNEPSDATYTKDGSKLTVVNDGCPNVTHFCRQGDKLWLRGQDATGRITVLELTKR